MNNNWCSVLNGLPQLRRSDFTQNSNVYHYSLFITLVPTAMSIIAAYLPNYMYDDNNKEM